MPAANWDKPHPVVIISHPDRAERKPVVEVVACATQRAGRQAGPTEALLDAANGMNWETICFGDMIYSVDKAALKNHRGGRYAVSPPRHRSRHSGGARLEHHALKHLPGESKAVVAKEGTQGQGGDGFPVRPSLPTTLKPSGCARRKHTNSVAAPVMLGFLSLIGNCFLDAPHLVDLFPLIPAPAIYG